MQANARIHRGEACVGPPRPRAEVREDKTKQMREMMDMFDQPTNDGLQPRSKALQLTSVGLLHD